MQGNPKHLKSGAEINRMMESKCLKIRAHGYCQPHFCMFWGGPAWNCDGSRREGVAIEHIIWAQDRVPGTMERRTSVNEK